MMQTQRKENHREGAANSYDVPIPKPPAELLDAFLSSLQSKLVTRRHPNGRTTNRQHDRSRAQGRNRVNPR
jgi:hypothetical protein